MSGGVDSSVSAALLLEQGYDVTGVFIKVWQPDFIECTWKEDRLDALRVAAQLGIPFVTLDLEKEYKQGVIDYMIEEYRIGRTPNPDVMCNREVKFGAFWRWAKEQGADYIATGHYAQVKTANSRQQTADIRTQTTELVEYSAGNKTLNHKPYTLHAGIDKNKDQTYFLWMLTSNDLEHTLFPIGHMEKDNVRKEAEKRGLYTSTKKDSQGLCFIGTIDLKTLLKEYIKEKVGYIVNEAGEVIGNHGGIMFYTIGERHGFTVTKKSIDDAPYYIIGKNIERNILIVSHTKPETKGTYSISLEKVSFFSETPVEGKVYEARGRYRAPLAKIKCHYKNNEWVVDVIEGDIVYTGGQSLVLYDDTKCLGGGVMK